MILTTKLGSLLRIKVEEEAGVVRVKGDGGYSQIQEGRRRGRRRGNEWSASS